MRRPSDQARRRRSRSILVAFILEGFVILYNLYGNEPKDRLLDRMEQLRLNIM